MKSLPIETDSQLKTDPNQSRDCACDCVLAHRVGASCGWVVMDKPAGLATGSAFNPSNPVHAPHIPSVVPTLASLVRQMFPDATGPMVVHRLDRATSGLVVFALDPVSHAQLSAQFHDRLVHKSYEAIVNGVPHERSGAVRLPIAKMDATNEDEPAIRRVCAPHGSPATTFWRVVRVRADRSCTHIRLWPITGRTHQIRLHCTTSWVQGGIGRPIVGDSLYGCSGTSCTPLRMMLHASSLSFVDPATNERVRFGAAHAFEKHLNNHTAPTIT